MSEEITVAYTGIGPNVQREIGSIEELEELSGSKNKWQIIGDSPHSGTRVSELSEAGKEELISEPESEESGSEVVELESAKGKKTSSIAECLPEELEVDPFSRRASKFFSEEELEALKDAEKAQEGNASDEELREKFNRSQVERQKEASKGEEFSEDLAHASRSSLARSNTWNEEPLFDSESESDSSSLSEEQLQAAAEAFEDRGGVWSDISRDIREEELSSGSGSSGSSEDSTVIKYISDDHSKGVLSTRNPELIEELHGEFADYNGVEIIGENGETVRARFDKEVLEKEF